MYSDPALREAYEIGYRETLEEEALTDKGMTT